MDINLVAGGTQVINVYDGITLVPASNFNFLPDSNGALYPDRSRTYSIDPTNGCVHAHKPGFGVLRMRLKEDGTEVLVNIVVTSDPTFRWSANHAFNIMLS